MVRAQTSSRRTTSSWREGKTPSPWAGLASPWVRGLKLQSEEPGSGGGDPSPAPAPETTTEPQAPEPAPLAPITTTDSPPAAEPAAGTPEKDPIEIARERAQQQAIEQLQKRVEALEAAANAEPVTAPSPLQ